MTDSPVVDALIREFTKDESYHKEGSDYSVSKTVSLLARIYEKARNAVEFRAEHLIRRAAIERILKRRVFLNGDNVPEIGEQLIVELLWARYIDSGHVDDAKVATVQHIIQKYLTVRSLRFRTTQVVKGVPWELVLGIASAEIEEVLFSAGKRQAIVNFFYQSIRPKIVIPDKDEGTVNILTYAAVERGFAQADDQLIYYHLLDIVQPEWSSLPPEKMEATVDTFIDNLSTIRSAMNDKLLEPLFRYVRKKSPPYLLIRDFLFIHGKKAGDIIADPEKLHAKLSEIAHAKYQQIGMKIRTAVVRSIIYIFFTKMVFALALEVPVDLLIVKRVDYLPLAINMLFPPFLLFLVAGFIRPPGERNTKRLISRINKIFYDFDELKEEKDVFHSQRRECRPFLTAVFSIFYLLTFLVSFGFISLVLTRLHFNYASQIIFVFFVTLVSFFAYRIRLSAKEYQMEDDQGFLSPLMDFFFLPVLRVGHILSSEIARLNVFIILFDFILEAPLKVIFEVIEEWIRFIRRKKDEII